LKTADKSMFNILTADQAAEFIQDGNTICIGGGGAGHAIPDEILKAIGRPVFRIRKT
jgi:propionate CoA-transferase